MDSHSFFLILLLVFVGARVFGELFAYFGLVAVLGEIFAGLILGPSGFAFISLQESGDLLKVLAEIGIMLLLFEIGFETDVSKLKDTGVQSSILAFGGAIFPFILGFFTSYSLLNLSLNVSLFIGGTLTATSIGITMRVLKDMGMATGKRAQIILGAAVMDDLLGILFLVFVYDYISTGEVSLIHTAKIFFFILIFFILTPIIAKSVAKIMRHLSLKRRVHGFIPSFIISLILLFSYIASLFGIPEILGSFAAGIAFSRRFIIPFASYLHPTDHDHSFLEHLRERMHPIIYLFSPIFFVYVGLSIDLSLIDFSNMHFWIISLLLISIAFLGKYIAALMVPHMNLKDKTFLGLSMIPRGEVGLIFAELGRATEVLDNEIYSILVLVVVVTTLVPPIIMKYFFNKI
ncbi:cation:proton antiporter [bacterium]|nr:cation:proton antiporter [bacterium]MBU1957803.1 cation:proton antiporter [bacterium]